MNVVITGASKGIGFAIAEIFAEHGHKLIICSRNEMTLYKSLESLSTRFPSAEIRARAADLSVKEQAVDFGKWCNEKFDTDILINNAGLFEPGQVHNEADGVLESQVATNLYSAYHVTRSLIGGMLSRKSGHIFNICSIASLDAYKNGGAYSISKFAMYGFSKNLREEMKSHGIKVTTVLPGAVLTDSWGNFDNADHRIMEASDIARMIYAASQLSPGACVEEILIRPVKGDL